MKNKMFGLLNQEHSGAVAFEYIIILVIMAVVIFFVWKTTLYSKVMWKARDLRDFIKQNGQNPMGTR